MPPTNTDDNLLKKISKFFLGPKPRRLEDKPPYHSPNLPNPPILQSPNPPMNQGLEEAM